MSKENRPTRVAETRRRRSEWAARLGAGLALLPGIAAGLDLCELFSDNAVLQRGMPVPVWGWDEPGSKVTVEFSGQKVGAVADGNGKWTATLQPLKLSKQAQDMTVSAGHGKIVRKDILVGDVWLCGGQSNMEMTFQTNRLPCDMPDFVKPEKAPMIRHLAVGSVGTKKVPKEMMESPRQRFQAGQVKDGWIPCDAQSYKHFTATGFFFAYTLAKEVDVPIGLLNITQGNTRIGSWVSPESIALVEDKVPRESFRAVYSTTPCSNYNTQVSSAAGFAIKGAIWYQGEANGKEGDSYFWKMNALIHGWREVWKQGDFPFYFAQLPSYNGKGSWAPIRDAQRKALMIPNTGMAVLTDVGDTAAEFPINLHPRNKYEVGRRLALWALAHDYGKKDLVHSGPLFRAAEFKDGKATVSFDHVGSGLMAAKKASSRSVEPPMPVAEVEGFEIAGADQTWSAAKARIDGDRVVLTAATVKNPKAARYLYTMNTDHGTLYNKDGLPASPFQTNDW